MTVEQMVSKANELIAKDARQHDAAKAASLIEAGMIPDGYVLVSQPATDKDPDQIAKYEAGSINVYRGGALKRSVPADQGTPGFDQALISYAVLASVYDRKTEMGRMA